MDFSSDSLSSFEIHFIKVEIILFGHVETHLLDLREKHHFDHAIFENIFSEWEFLSLTGDQFVSQVHEWFNETEVDF